MSRRWHPGSCKVCRKQATEDDPISAQGYCLEHGLSRLNENNLQINAKSGPFFEHWARRTILKAHAALVASERAEG